MKMNGTCGVYYRAKESGHVGKGRFSKLAKKADEKAAPAAKKKEKEAPVEMPKPEKLSATLSESAFAELKKMNPRRKK